MRVFRERPLTSVTKRLLTGLAPEGIVCCVSMPEEQSSNVSPLYKERTVGPQRSFALPVASQPHEVMVEEVQVEPAAEVPVDHLASLKRRLLIAYHAYGSHATAKIAAFIDQDTKTVLLLLQEEDVQLAIRCNHVPSWTPAEIVAKLSVEAEKAQKPQDRIAALKLLMEYRSMAAPEGGSRSFKRIAAKFTMGGNDSQQRKGA